MSAWLKHNFCFKETENTLRKVFKCQPLQDVTIKGQSKESVSKTVLSLDHDGGRNLTVIEPGRTAHFGSEGLLNV